MIIMYDSYDDINDDNDVDDDDNDVDDDDNDVVDDGMILAISLRMKIFNLVYLAS